MRLLIITIAFITLLICACEMERVAPLTEQNKKMLALFDEEASVIGFVNYENIRESEIYDLFMQYMEDTPFDNPDYKEFVQATGFDFQKDMNRFYFAGYKGDPGKRVKGIFIASGNFDPDKIMEFVASEAENENHQLNSEDYGAFTVFSIEEEHLHFCFPDNKTLIGGSEALVKAGLDKFGQENILNSAVETDLKKVKYKDGAWIYMDANTFVDAIEDMAIKKRMPALKNIKIAQCSMNLTDHIVFEGIGVFSDDEHADMFEDVVEGAIATAKLSVSDDRDAVDVLNKIEVDEDGNELEVTFTMSKEEIELLLKKQKEQLEMIL
jgi:hypothetical protein